MSNIWHKTNEKPMLHRDIILCGDGWSMAMDIVPETVNNICWKNVEKWCYLDDLLDLEHKNAQLAHKVDVALAGLKYIQQNCLEYAADYMDYADTLIEKIKDTK